MGDSKDNDTSSIENILHVGESQSVVDSDESTKFMKSKIIEKVTKESIDTDDSKFSENESKNDGTSTIENIRSFPVSMDQSKDDGTSSVENIGSFPGSVNLQVEENQFVVEISSMESAKLMKSTVIENETTESIDADDSKLSENGSEEVESKLSTALKKETNGKDPINKCLSLPYFSQPKPSYVEYTNQGAKNLKTPSLCAKSPKSIRRNYELPPNISMSEEIGKETNENIYAAERSPSMYPDNENKVKPNNCPVEAMARFKSSTDNDVIVIADVPSPQGSLQRFEERCLHATTSKRAKEPNLNFSDEIGVKKPVGLQFEKTQTENVADGLKCEVWRSELTLDESKRKEGTFNKNKQMNEDFEAVIEGGNEVTLDESKRKEGTCNKNKQMNDDIEAIELVNQVFELVKEVKVIEGGNEEVIVEIQVEEIEVEIEAEVINLENEIAVIDLKNEVPVIDLENEVPVIDLENEVPVIDLENEVPVIELANEVPVIELANEVPVIELANEVPVIELANEVPVIELANEVPVIELANEVPVIELANEVPVIELANEVPVIELANEVMEQKNEDLVLIDLAGDNDVGDLNSENTEDNRNIDSMSNILGYDGDNEHSDSESLNRKDFKKPVHLSNLSNIRMYKEQLKRTKDKETFEEISDHSRKNNLFNSSISFPLPSSQPDGEFAYPSEQEMYAQYTQASVLCSHLNSNDKNSILSVPYEVITISSNSDNDQNAASDVDSQPGITLSEIPFMNPGNILYKVDTFEDNLASQICSGAFPSTNSFPCTPSTSSQSCSSSKIIVNKSSENRSFDGSLFKINQDFKGTNSFPCTPSTSSQSCSSSKIIVNKSSENRSFDGSLFKINQDFKGTNSFPCTPSTSSQSCSSSKIIVNKSSENRSFDGSLFKINQDFKDTNSFPCTPSTSSQSCSSSKIIVNKSSENRSFDGSLFKIYQDFKESSRCLSVKRRRVTLKSFEDEDDCKKSDISAVDKVHNFEPVIQDKDPAVQRHIEKNIRAQSFIDDEAELSGEKQSSDEVGLDAIENELVPDKILRDQVLKHMQETSGNIYDDTHILDTFLNEFVDEGEELLAESMQYDNIFSRTNKDLESEATGFTNSYDSDEDNTEMCNPLEHQEKLKSIKESAKDVVNEPSQAISTQDVNSKMEIIGKSNVSVSKKKNSSRKRKRVSSNNKGLKAKRFKEEAIGMRKQVFFVKNDQEYPVPSSPTEHKKEADSVLFKDKIFEQ